MDGKPFGDVLDMVRTVIGYLEVAPSSEITRENVLHFARGIERRLAGTQPNEPEATQEADQARQPHVQEELESARLPAGATAAVQVEEREAFERWWCSLGHKAGVLPAEFGWAAWQERAASAPINYEPLYDFAQSYSVDYNSLCQAVRAAMKGTTHE